MPSVTVILLLQSSISITAGLSALKYLKIVMPGAAARSSKLGYLVAIWRRVPMTDLLVDRDKEHA